MDQILSAGIEFILFVQALGTPGTDRFFAEFTKLGSTGYLLLVPPLLWCVDPRLGMRVVLAMALTLFVNSVLKEWVGLDRPFLVDDRIVSDGERDFAMPSGHAQLVVAYWVLLARYVDRRWFWIFAVGWMFLMGFSRVYLGVHYPSDVVVGWAIGAATTWGFVSRADDLDALWSAVSPGRVAVTVTAVAAFMFAFDAIAVRAHGYMIPGISGFVLGAGLGALWTGRRGVFTGEGAAWQRAGRIALGLVMGLLLLGGMRRMGAPESEWGTRFVVTFDLALFGLWLTGLAPWIFEKTRLATRVSSEGEEAPSAGATQPPV